jgi:SHS2 domain-containing protein
MQLQIVSEYREIKKDYGFFPDEKIQNLITAAELLSLDCLSTLDVVGDTYLQDTQSLEIKKELEILKQQSKVDEKLLNTIQEAIDIVLTEDFLFLKFIGL